MYLFEINKWNAHGNGNDEVVRGDDRIDFSKHFGHQWWLGCHDDNLGTFDYLHIFSTTGQGKRKKDLLIGLH